MTIEVINQYTGQWNPIEVGSLRQINMLNEDSIYGIWGTPLDEDTLMIFPGCVITKIPDALDLDANVLILQRG